MKLVATRSARRTLLAAGVSVCVSLAGCAQVYDTGLARTSGTTDLGADDSKGPTQDFSAPPSQPPVDASAPASVADLSTACDVHAIKVNELQTAGANGASDEFIELYNPCSAPVAMTNAVIVYRASTSNLDAFAFWTFKTETIAAGGHFLLANTSYAGTSDAKPFLQGGMAATGGAIALKLGAVVVDSVGWGTATNAYVETLAVGAPASGQSAARKPDGTDTHDNAVDFVRGASTPGAAN